MRKTWIALLLSLLFGCTEVGLAIALAFAPSSGYEIPVFLSGTFILVYICLLAFTKLTGIDRARFWHALVVFGVGGSITATLAYFVGAYAGEPYEASMYFFLSGLGIAFLLPFPFLLIYHRLLSAIK